MRNYLIEGSYFLASILFILGLRGLSHPETARRGMHLAEFGMLMAIIGTLMHREIVSYEWIIAGLLIGSAIGTGIGLWVPMTAMPQRTAFSHAFGAFAAALVGVSEYSLHGASLSKFTMGALGFDVLLGSLTTTGSLIAFAKLQGMLPGRPLTYKGQNIFNLSLLGVIILAFVVLIFQPGATFLFYLMLILSLVFGVLLVLPIGSADMPVVIALLNAYAGLASAAIGFAISNNVLIIAGTLDGGSGLILSIVMCRAMNRSITGVLFGAFGKVSDTKASSEAGAMREANVEDFAVSTRLRPPGGLCARLRNGYRPGTARASRTFHGAGRSGRHCQICDPPGRRTHARPHECAPGGSQYSLLPALRARTDQFRLPGDRCRGRGGRERRRQSGCPR